jgi:hypothetical protein
MKTDDFKDESYDELTEGATRTKRFFQEVNARRIAGLKVGQSHTECVRLSHDDNTRKEIKKAAHEMAWACNTALQRARIREPNKEFCSDQGFFRTRDYDIILLFVVTRIQ